MTTTKKKLMLGTSLFVGAALASSMANAQATLPAATDDQATEVEEIIITGSRLRRESFDTATPVLQIDEEEFVQTGAANAIDVLEEIPLVGAGSNSQGANAQFGDNFAFVDLFNLGTQRTLTLVNGRRFISGNQATVFVPDNATGAQVDLTVIPPALIERVEVTPLTGGAIYGADAVGGVVNVLLKDDFEGIEYHAQVGITQEGDGERYRAGVAWGTDFYNGQGNITLALDYLDQNLISSGTGSRDFLTDVGALTNLDNGFVRSDPLTIGQGADMLRDGGALPSAFLPGGSDLQRPSIFTGPLRNGMITLNGLLTTGQAYIPGFGGTSALVPNGFVAPSLAGAAADPDGFAFFAPSALPGGPGSGAAVLATLSPGADLTGLTPAQIDALALNALQRSRPTPREYFMANPGLDPNLFVGTFGGGQTVGPQGPLGMFPTINNSDPATSALFPRIAVPLQFDGSGNLVSHDYGDPLRGLYGTNVGGDAFANGELGYTNLQSATERASFAALGRFDITPNVVYHGELMYTDIAYRSIGGVDTNSLGGSTTAGNRALPVYIDENPYFGSDNLAEINGLVAQGLNVPVLNGERVLYINRALRDIYDGPVQSGNDVEMFRHAHALTGDFSVFNRQFYWDASYVYGQNSIVNIGENILDTEFALATDVVDEGEFNGGPANGNIVCRQQLTGPESIAIRNPGLSAINTQLGLTPTQAQIDACVPFNVFGEYNSTVTDELRDYVTADTGSTNEARQHYLQASFGGEIFRLPAGWISAGAQIEWRKESLDFQPNPDFATGAARNTTGAFSNGSLRFLEYGYEVAIPIFGGDFTLPGFQALELTGAYRIVDRDQETLTAGFAASPGTTDEVYQASVRWQVTQDLQLRANQSTSVRSASIIELFGAPGAGFVNGTDGLLPCTPQRITQGPNPTVRRENCIQAVILTGAASNRADAETFLDNYTPTVASRPAATSGNPFLNNEESEAFGAGFTLTPRWFPNLVIAADYYEAEITGQVGLVGVPTTINECFDQATFPDSSLAGTPACDLFTIGVLDPATGTYVNPTTTLTGNPVLPISNPGAPAVANRPFEAAFFTYPNFNLAAVQLEAATLEVRYNFAIEDLFGPSMADWGQIFLSGSVYNLISYDTSASGTFLDTNPSAGEPGFSEWVTRLDVAHRFGRFDHRLTWLRNSATVNNVQTAEADYPEQNFTFRTPSYSLFNYTVGYELRDNIDVRLTVNNLFNSREPYEELGVVNDAIGRTYLFSVRGRF